MEAELPSGFLDLRTALLKAGAFASVVGVCAYSSQEPRESKGGDWFVTLTVKDHSLPEGGYADVRIFGASMDLPSVLAGDICICRFVTVLKFRGKTLLSATGKSQVYILPCSSIPGPTSRLSFTRSGSTLQYQSCPPMLPHPTQEETVYALALHDWDVVSNPYAAQQPEPSAQTLAAPDSHKKREKFALVNDMTPNNFYDMVGEVEHMFDVSGGPCLRMIDYSAPASAAEDPLEDAHSTTGKDGDEFGYTVGRTSKPTWSDGGPSTIQVKLFDANAVWATRNVQVGDKLLLQNIRTRIGLSGLEARLHGDRMYPDKVMVHKIQKGTAYFPRLEEMMRRKEELFRQNAEHQSPEPVNKGAGPQKNQANAARKKAKNRRRKKQTREEEEGKSNKLRTSHLTDPAPTVQSNSLVRCGHLDIPLLSVADIMRPPRRTSRQIAYGGSVTPFRNFKCRTKLRIIDFDPPNLEDFARSLDDPTYNDALSDPESDDDMMGGSQHRSRWEWAFRLLVEDAIPSEEDGQESAKMVLIVAGLDAEYLLRLDATDLRQNRSRLAQLREKLFHLWGDLEEVKRAAAEAGDRDRHHMVPTSRPFECCIKEYGVDRSRNGSGPWLRCHRMFATTIS